VDADGKQLGIKSLPDAQRIAREADLDLVEVAPMANPPVCRIMDYGKFKYDNEQRAKESRRKTSNVSIKEMKYRPKIGTGDFDTKTRQVARFLAEGHKVKLTIMFRGREMSHPELGKKILDRVAEEVVNLAKVEAAPKLDGRNMIMVLAPDKKAQLAAKAAAEEAEGAVAEADGAGADSAATGQVQEVVIEAADIEAADLDTPEIAAPEIAAPEVAAAAAEDAPANGAATAAAAPQTQES
jgi:translation initiation factor IF-3